MGTSLVRSSIRQPCLSTPSSSLLMRSLLAVQLSTRPRAAYLPTRKESVAPMVAPTTTHRAPKIGPKTRPASSESGVPGRNATVATAYTAIKTRGAATPKPTTQPRSRSSPFGPMYPESPVKRATTTRAASASPMPRSLREVADLVQALHRRRGRVGARCHDNAPRQEAPAVHRHQVRRLEAGLVLEHVH